MDNAIQKANAMMERDMIRNLTEKVKRETIKEYSSIAMIEELKRRDVAVQDLVANITKSLVIYQEALNDRNM